MAQWETLEERGWGDPGLWPCHLIWLAVGVKGSG